MSELRQALRSLATRPGLSALVIGTLALGIGASAAIFSLLDTLLLKPLPVLAPDRLVLVRSAVEGGKPGGEQTYARYLDLRHAAEARAFDALAARWLQPLTLSDGAGSDRVLGEIVSGNYFAMLGVDAERGRVLTMGDDDEGRTAEPVAVLSHGYWQRRFGGDPAILGRIIRLNGQPFTVVGITPASFFGVEVGVAPDVRVTLAMEPRLRGRASLLARRSVYWLDLIGRLAPGVSPSQAAAPLTAVLARDPETASQRAVLLPAARGVSSLRGRFEQPLLVLLGLVSAMLLVATANVANLLLTRAVSRRREMAVRLALGASPARLLRLHAIEGLLLAVAGGMFGWILAYQLPRVLLPFLPLIRAFPAHLDLSIDVRLLLFWTLAVLVAGAGAGVLPAWQGWRTDGMSAMKLEAGASAGWRKGQHLHRALAIVQIAVSVVLLVSAGLFVRTLQELRVATGQLDTERLLVADIDPASRGYDEARLQVFYRDLQQRLQRLPGVEQASLARMRVLSGALRRSSAHLRGALPSSSPSGAARDARISIDENLVQPGYFEAMGMQLLRGRAISHDDGEGRPRVAVINETLARAFVAGGVEPIGARYAYSAGPDAQELLVIGIVRDAKNASLREPAPPMAYLALAQAEGGLSPVTIHLRTAGAPMAIAGQLRQELRAMDAELPVYGLRTMEAQRELVMGQERLVAWLAGGFGLLALGIAAVGLFAVLSYAVSRRTRDLGIRIALGADPARLRALVLRDTLRIALAGLALGIPAALVVSRSLRTLLFGVAPADLPTLVMASVTLLVAALIAGDVPARRATRVDPLTALRLDS